MGTDSPSEESVVVSDWHKSKLKEWIKRARTTSEEDDSACSYLVRDLAKETLDGEVKCLACGAPHPIETMVYVVLKSTNPKHRELDSGHVCKGGPCLSLWAQKHQEKWTRGDNSHGMA